MKTNESPSSTIVRAESLTKVFIGPRQRGGGRSETIAVDDVSFDVPAAASLGIVGESGSGKTTVARIIAGLTVPSSGRVIVDGRERTAGRISREERRKRAGELQIVFQDPYSSLNPRQRVHDCLAEVVAFHFRQGKSERDREVDRLLEQVGLDQRTSRALPRALSGGQRQRVAIARAMAPRPQVLILDEAVSALDVSIQAQILNLLADIREETNVAYIFVSHDLGVVRQIAERVIVMRTGRVVERGSTSDVLDDPRDEYTKRLLASVPGGPGWEPRSRDQVGTRD